MSTEHTANVKGARCKYIFSGATVQGLPTRRFLQSEGKYWLKLSFDRKEGWSTRELRTKGSTAVWSATEDRHGFEQAPTSILHVTLCKNHSDRPVEELGTAALPVGSWLTQVASLVRNPPTKDKGTISITLSLTLDGSTVPQPALEPVVQQAVHAAVGDASGLRTLVGLSTVSAASDQLQPIKGALTGDVVGGIASAWEPLLDKLDAFTRMMDAVAEVHPYAKMAWTVLSAAYKLVKSQQDRDAKIDQLVQKMQSVYEFLCDAQDLQSNKAHEGVLSRLAAQTVECGHFISSYARNPSFFRRLLEQSASNMTVKINEYSASFDDLLQDFRTGSQLRTEIATVRMLADIQELAVDMDIRDIPYADGAGYELGRRCLPGTRSALLDEITDWASAESPDTPRMYVLMGPAGTGKSTIAHTIASRFDKLKQLGSVFCFSTSEETTRTPPALFPNMARDLCEGRPAFKAALSKSIGGSKSRCTTRDLVTQFETFILGPARLLAICGTVVIIIDALDESGRIDARARLLSMISQRLRELHPCFRFLITARAEPDIQESFPDSNPDVIVKRMPTLLSDTRLSTDVLHYIRHSLVDNCGKLPRGLSDASCVILATKAEGLFQWAFVACQHIKSPRIRQTPFDRYRLVTERSDTGLDGLYTDILSQVFDQDPEALLSFRAIMGLVLTAMEPLCMQSLDALMVSLQPEETLDIYAFLPFLGSLMSGVGEQTVPVRPLHSSFAELLQSPDRGGQCYIGASGHHERLVTASLRLLKTQLHFNMGRLETSYRLNQDHDSGRDSSVSEGLSYACKHWGHHLSTCCDDFEYEVAALLRHLFVENLLFWLDAASLAGAISHIPGCISSAMNRLQNLDDDISQVAKDAIKFVRAFARPIVDSAGQVYISALMWTPVATAIAKIYGARYQTARVASRQPTFWPNLNLIIGVTEKVMCVIFTPDSRRLVGGSWDGTVHVWDAETGHASGEPFAAHGSYVSSVAISSDGKRIVSGSGDRTVRMWDAETGRAIGQPLEGHKDSVTSVAVSSDGRRILSGSDDKTVRIWDGETGHAIGRPLEGHEETVTAVAISSDGKLGVSASQDETVRIWDLETGHVIGASIVDPGRFVMSVAMSGDGKRIVSGSLDGRLRIWDADTGQLIGAAEGHDGIVTSLAISANGARIVSGCGDNTVRVWDAQTGKAIGQPLDGHQNSVMSVAISSDGLRIVSSSEDKTIRIWDADTGGGAGLLLEGQGGAATSVALTPDNHQTSSDDQDGDTVGSQPEAKMGHILGILWDDEEDAVNSVAMSSDGTRVVFRSQDGTVRVWDAETGHIIGEPLPNQEYLVNSVCISSDGKTVVLGTPDDIVRIWDTETGHVITGSPSQDSEDSVTSVAMSLNGACIVSGSDHSTVRIWNTETGHTTMEPLGRHEAWVTSVAVSSNGQRIVSGSYDKTVRIWEVGAGNSISQSLEGHTDIVNSVAISSDGMRVVSGSDDSTVRIWNLDAGCAISVTLEDDSWVKSVAISSAGRRIASGSVNNTVRIWDGESGHAIGQPLAGHDGWVTSVAISSDGRRVASGSYDGTVRIWNTDLMLGITGLSLSPEPAHQLMQPYVPGGGEEIRVKFDWETGWIVANESDYLLWIPPDEMRNMHTGQCTMIIPRENMVTIDLSRFVHGTRWTECFQG